MSHFSHFLKKTVNSSLFDNAPSDFWHNWGWLLFVGAVFLYVAIFLIVSHIIRARKSKIESRSVEFEGEIVDSAKLVWINLIGSSPVTLNKGDVFIAPLIEKEGYEFGGWFYDSARSKPYLNRRITKDLTLYPKWIQRSR